MTLNLALGGPHRIPFPTIQIGLKPQTSPNATENSTVVARAIPKGSSPPRSPLERTCPTKKPLALIFTADEEIGLRGAKQLAQAKPLRVRYSIVGEPTSLKPIRAGKGYSLAEVIVKGREAHSAYPALGASAVFRAARLINRLESNRNPTQRRSARRIRSAIYDAERRFDSRRLSEERTRR